MIIQSLLDLDFYKITMCQLAHKSFPNTIVEYAFKNRKSSIRLAEIIPIDRLRTEINSVKTLTLSNSQLDFLRKQEIFSEDFLEYLYKINRSIPLSDVNISVIDGQYDIHTTGAWPIAIFWETIILSIVNELYYESKYGTSFSYLKGLDKLSDKIKILKQYPGIKFSDFGTRRRASQNWQALVVNKLKHTLPDTQFIGTSNVQLAMSYGLKPIGTFAHELPMIASGIWYDTDESLRASHGKILDMWYELYGKKLSTALTDTFGSKFFFEDFDSRANDWNGLRQDSGDPFEFGENAINYYVSRGIDPMTKTIVFSDGLDLEKIIQLHIRFNGRINVVYGWGTTLTNDLGYETLSIVMKAVRANGNELVKLSDNLNKATGSEAVLSRYKYVFGYTNTQAEDCKV